MTPEEIRQRLVEMAKQKCKITWESETTENEIREISEEACLAIKRKVGLPANTEDHVFLKPGIFRTLWKEYCLYGWNDAIEEFDKDYLSEIIQARRECEVLAYAKKKKDG